MKFLPLFAIISILFLSCSKDKLTASGDKTTETRFPGQFSGVNASGSNPVKISYGPEFKVEIKGSNNLIPYFKTNILNNTLYLGYEKASVQHDDIEIFISLPAIRKAVLSGSGKISIEGAFPNTSELKLSISGSGDILVKDKFETEESLVSISGSGKADLQKVDSKKAQIDISGSGTATVNVQNKLKADISGSGKVYYMGSPEVDADISGSGKVIKL
uniref:head GIN domain-containing protein n=1 Tax=Pedobacter schmidteae TaxID=2201271 RepID=UPI000EAB48AC|nr:head GIN domain-containing protein [Pedobacter schmidteae]